jgi:hypothetical protein
MGIWLPVYLRTTGSVTIADPKVVTTLPSLPDTTKAVVSVSFNLNNHGTADQKGKVTVTISPENFQGKPLQFTKEISVGKNQTANVGFTAENKSEIQISNPASCFFAERARKYGCLSRIPQRQRILAGRLLPVYGA